MLVAEERSGMRVAPPLSPFLIAGRLMPPGGERVLERVLRMVVSGVWRAHPVIGERLRPLGDVGYRIEPTDLPVAVVLRIRNGAPHVRVADPGEAMEATAVVRGGVEALLALLSGQADGDALFFSRIIAVEGDTGAVVALRNALDDAGVDLIADLTAGLGPLARPANGAVRRAAGVWRRLSEDMTTLADAVRAPLARRADAQGYVLDDLEKRLERLERRSRRSRAP
jgi:predicted lipid carrier protein YhbT